jgi:hypothetical protein
MPFLAVVFIRDAGTATRVRRNWAADGYEDNGYKVVGMYRWPQPTGTCNGFCGPMGWKRRKDGVMVHTCGRRNSAWRKHITGWFFDMFGRNLVKDPPGMFRTPDGY